MRKRTRYQKDIARRQGDMMVHFIKTGDLMHDYEKKNRQRDILKEMNKLHAGTGVKTVNEHGIETGLEA